MKRFIIILLMGLSILSADTINEEKIDIYFGNGVWNNQFTKTNCQKQDAAECSQRELNDLVKQEIIQNNPKLVKRYGSVKLAYNWTRGAVGDLLETFYQLKNSGQITQTAFFALVDELAAKTAADVKDTPLEEMRKIIIDALSQTEQSNIDAMLPKYYLESLYESHRVLLVSHSQGNMFANRIYDSIAPKEYQNYFANLQVASPASSVHAKMGNYVTNIGDGVINPLPGSMEGNVHPDSYANLDLNHPFVSSYLSYKEPVEKILKDMRELLENLNQTQSQWYIKKETQKGTVEYRGLLAHKFHSINDDSLYGNEDLENVYLFKDDNNSAYIYQVPNTAGTPHYVKASFGGERILDAELDAGLWEAKDNQFYKLEGTDPVEYIEGDSKEIKFNIFYEYRVGKHNRNGTYYGDSAYLFSSETSCSRHLGGSSWKSPYPDYHTKTDEQGLAGVAYTRNNQERYWYTTFPSMRNSLVNKGIECVLAYYGYTLDNVTSIVLRN